MIFGQKNHYENGQIILSVTGTIDKIWPKKEGEGQYGPWTMQNAVYIVDGDKVNLTCWFEIPSVFEGREVTFKSAQGKKGISGVQYEHKEIKGQMREGIKVSGHAEIYIDGERWIDSYVDPKLNLPENKPTDEQHRAYAAHGNKGPLPPRNAPPASGSGPVAEGKPIAGITVGMVCNNSAPILLELHKNNPSYFKSAEFSRDLHQIMSDMIRVAALCEKGKLAAAPKDSEPPKPAPQPQPEPPQPESWQGPEPDGIPGLDDGNLDDEPDIPF